MEVLNGLNVDLLSNVMASFGLKYIIGEEYFWWEKTGPYDIIILKSSKSRIEIVNVIYNYLTDIQNSIKSGTFDPDIKEFEKSDGKNTRNLFIPSKAGRSEPIKLIYDVYKSVPSKKYIEDTLFVYPYIQDDKNLSPIRFSEENQRTSYKMGCCSSNNKDFPLSCNRVIQSLMWIGIEKYIDTYEVNILRSNNIGFYFVSEIYSRTKSLMQSSKLQIPILDRNMVPIKIKQYKQGISGNSYFYWEFEKEINIISEV